VPVTELDDVLVTDDDAVPVTDDDAVPEMEDEAVLVTDDDAVPLTDDDAVPVADDDAVPVALDDGVCDGLGVTPSPTLSQHTEYSAVHCRSFIRRGGSRLSWSDSHPPITQSSSPPKSLGSPSAHRSRPVAVPRMKLVLRPVVHSQQQLRDVDASVATSFRPSQYLVPAGRPQSAWMTNDASA
jgi:hypothetical protein